MTKRAILAQGERYKCATRVDNGVWLGESYPVGGHTLVKLTEPEARHLAKWLKEQGFLDD